MTEQLAESLEYVVGVLYGAEHPGRVRTMMARVYGATYCTLDRAGYLTTHVRQRESRLPREKMFGRDRNLRKLIPQVTVDRLTENPDAKLAEAREQGKEGKGCRQLRDKEAYMMGRAIAMLGKRGGNRDSGSSPPPGTRDLRRNDGW